MWTPADIPDLTGRTAVVTGANGGLGLVTASELAAKGAHVVLAARDQDKAKAADEQIHARTPQASTEIVPLDLGSLASVTDAAEKILAGPRVIDLLVNNAGLMAMPERRTEDGFEMQFGVDHLGHFAFTAHLLPALLRAGPGPRRHRHQHGPLHGQSGRPAQPEPRRPVQAVARLRPRQVGQLPLRPRPAAAVRAGRRACAEPDRAPRSVQHRPAVAHRPGGRRRLERGALGGRGEAQRHDPAEGARPQLRAATDPKAKGGELYAPRFGGNGPAVRRPILRRWDLQKRIDELWLLSERETGVVLDVSSARP